MKTRLFLFLLFISTTKVFSDLLPDYDTRCDSMLCHPAKIDTKSKYFEKKVPKNIHQIWFGGPMKPEHEAKIKHWKKYASRFKYKYKLWTEKDIDKFMEFVSPKNFELIMKMISIEGWWAASDILRCELIKNFGGVYVDCDFSPPTKNGRYVDLKKIINFHGLTLMTEHHARNIRTTGIFVANGFIVAPPSHPVINSMVDQFAANIDHWYKLQQNYDPMFITGPFLLNKVLSGTFNIVPCLYLLEFNMYN